MMHKRRVLSPRCVSLLMRFIVLSLVLVLLFSFILPLGLREWAFSRYYEEPANSKLELARVERQNARRLRSAEAYIHGVNSNRSALFYKLANRQQPLDLVLVIVTVDRDREAARPLGYLTQVVAAFDKQIKDYAAAEGGKIGAFICNADFPGAKHHLAQRLSALMPVVSRGSSDKPVLRKTIGADVKYDKERSDYVFCLGHALTHFNARYVLLAQDDAMPLPNFFATLSYVLSAQVTKELSWRDEGGLRSAGGTTGTAPSTRHDWALCKLYYPERWLGYSWTYQSVAELAGMGITGGCLGIAAYWLLAIALMRRGYMTRENSRGLRDVELCTAFCFTFVLTIALCWVIGRQYLLEIRKLAQFLHFVSDAPNCCIPAVVYPGDKAEWLRDFLSAQSCSVKYPVDLAIDDFIRQTGLRQYLVEPNLVRHIGLYSSLATKHKAPGEFIT